MKFGFVTNVLKTLGKAALPMAETLATTAATAAGGPLLGSLVPMIFAGVKNAAAKHGDAPNSAVIDTDNGMTVGQAKKFDVMQLLESQAPELANLILGGARKKVVDRERFLAGVDKITEGVVDVLKSVGEIASATPPADPVVITPAVVSELKQTPAPGPLSTFAGVISNLGNSLASPEVPKSVNPLEIAALLEQAVAKLRGL